MAPLASPTVRLVCCLVTIVTVIEVIKDTLFNMLQCFSLFYSYMSQIHQLYLVCNPSRLVSQYFFLYRATLCVSAVFAVVRYASVQPFVTFVYYIQTGEDIVKLLSCPAAPSF